MMARTSGRRLARRVLLGLCLGALIVGMVAPTASAADTKTRRVSVKSNGKQSNATSIGASVSANGRYVAFETSATNLVRPDTKGWENVFVRDRVSKRTRLVSVRPSGKRGNNDSGNPAISAGGRYVAFESLANNLVEGDLNDEPDIFVQDRRSGKVRRVSISSTRTETDESSGKPAISGDGRYVTFESRAGNLIASDTNGVSDIYIHDRRSGRTKRASLTRGNAQADGPSTDPDISSSGRFVAFVSQAANIVPGDTNGKRDVFVRDRKKKKTIRVSRGLGGADPNDHSARPAISGDGRYVTFVSEANNLVASDGNGVADIFLFDRKTKLTSRVSVRSSGTQANARSGAPDISSNGRFVGFVSNATNLVKGDTNVSTDAFLHDRKKGRTRRLSVRTNGNQGNRSSLGLSISSDGRAVALESNATNLVKGDTNGKRDIFTRAPLR